MKFLDQLLGRKWGRKIILIIFIDLALISLVLYFNWDKIKFNPGAFVQESIKTILSLTLIYFIIEYQKYSTEKNKAVYNFKNFLKFQILRPLKQVIENLELAKTNSEELKFLKSRWVKFYPKFKELDLYEYNIDFKNTSLYDFQETYSLEKINNFIITLHNNSFVEKTAQFEENLKQLTLLFAKFSELNNSI